MISALILGLSFPASPASHAIFGLSGCEKTKAKLSSEQAIGFENWKNFDSYRDGLIKNKSFNYYELREIFLKIKIVLQSDKKIYDSIEKNNNCFEATFSAKNRENLTSLNNQVSQITAGEKTLQKYTPSDLNQKVTKDIFNYIKTSYQEFYDWKTGKVISKK
jgi:hypothetical protein